MHLRICGLQKAFGHSPALRGIDLDIASGELLGLLGPSGSGKTTLLRTIAGLEVPTAGQIFYGGEDASVRSVQERRVGFVFQGYALFRHMSVAENVAYGLQVRPRRARPPAAIIRRRVDDLLEMMQLAGFAGRYPAQLSGGQRQRVALARALAVEPRVLLLDEPFGALDARVRKDLRRWLREVHDRTGHTTVFVTHDQDEALELSDRIAVLNQGRVEQIASPDEVYERPATPFVFSFIGHSNQVDVTVANGRACFAGVDIGGVGAEIPYGKGHAFFRPQHATLRKDGRSALRGAVRSIRRVTALWHAEIMLVDGRTMVEVGVPEGTRFTEGDPVSIDVHRYRVFAAAPG
jgi:sulfate transport system ATP-binding protein